jgi:hypothetical protein
MAHLECKALRSAGINDRVFGGRLGFLICLQRLLNDSTMVCFFDVGRLWARALGALAGGSPSLPGIAGSCKKL